MSSNKKEFNYDEDNNIFNDFFKCLSNKEEYFKNISSNLLIISKLISEFCESDEAIIKAEIIELIGIIFLFKAVITEIIKNKFSKKIYPCYIECLKIVIVVLFLIGSILSVYVVIKEYELKLQVETEDL